MLPSEVMTAEGADLFQGWRMLREFQTWPTAGGWLRQSAKFISGLDICDQAVVLYRGRIKEREKEAQTLAAEAARLFGRKQ